jgi:hypothetical protein
LIIYAGRDTTFQLTLISEEKSKAAVVVLPLVEPLLGKGHTVVGQHLKCTSTGYKPKIYENQLGWNAVPE